MRTVYIIENIIITVASCVLCGFLFWVSSSFHSFWVFAITTWLYNSPKAKEKHDAPKEE